jgi:DNA repair photolyase
MAKITGTKEWAVANVNCLIGCSNGCRYCYGKSMARRFGRVSPDAEWIKPRLRVEEVGRKRYLKSGTIMFPTTHDITPEFLEPCITVLKKLLEAGNRVLVVSKPHLACIERICKEFSQYKDRILFRFTIGAFDNDLLAFWEPGAPTFDERLACLKLAYDCGFQTNVSVEPMLDSPNVVALYRFDADACLPSCVPSPVT